MQCFYWALKVGGISPFPTSESVREGFPEVESEMGILTQFISLGVAPGEGGDEVGS